MASIGQTPTPSSSGSRSSLSISSPFFTHNSSNHSISATPSTSKFKTFRSLLPFGVASASKPTVVGRERKGSLGHGSSGRKDVDRKASLQLPSSFLPPVIAIESGRGDFEEEVRRGLENSPQAQSTPGRPHTFREPLPTAFMRSKPLPAEPSPPHSPSRLPSPRIPSPLASPLPSSSLALPPSPSADLSTIVEADTSGISLSRHLPDESCDLSTSQLDEQVRDAMTATPGWDGFQVDVEEPSFSVEMDTVHPDIAALLSPNNLSNTLVNKKQSSLPRLRPKSTGSSPGSGSGSTGRVSPAGRISPAPPSPLRASHTRPPPSRTSTSPPVFTPPSRTLPSRAASVTRPSLDTRRTRKRSMSTTTPSRPSTSMSVEWLGPRTAKAFRAAGLLDESAPPAHQPRRGSVDSRYTAPLSRFGSVRSDRSASRMSSESPRSASTAPTSLSWGDRDKEEDTTRHAMEMSALLGALSDSQRTARVLREENAELRERLESREEELLGIIGQLEDAQRYGEDERVGELEEENAVLRSVVDDLRREIGDMLRKKRYSAVSSVFPAPPANMTMLVGEDPDVGWMKDAVRPPSADLSILTMSDGSQVSLALKPEHAMHLGDMDAMSLYDVSADR
ncbi:hypothetical protein BDZ89DRAFT_1160478 [Hymenopellis radicata]|nr:hypothetical protein BDZ89DRAFT_1160478 [Hymenopellis radicata]